MQNIVNYSCGGDSVVIFSGVSDGDESAVAAQIIRADALGVQTGFLKNTAIKIPSVDMPGAVFAADAALCAGAVLAQQSGEAGHFSLRSNALGAPFSVSASLQGRQAELSFAAKAKISLGSALPCVVFGGCEYYVAEVGTSERFDADFLAGACEKSACACVALLEKNGDEITPHFCRKQGAPCSFSAGSAAIALAFFESESSRDLIQKTYRFPKGVRSITMKRFLSEPFECALSAQVIQLG